MSEPDLVDTSPRRFSFRQRVVLALAPAAIASVLKGMTATYSLEIRNKEFLDTVIERYGRAIVAIWHEVIVSMLARYRGSGACALTSYSFDGELATRTLRSCGIGAVRGSSSRGGSEALHQLARAMERVEIVGTAFDGPRGPRREAKPGVAILSARTGIPVLPNAFGVVSAWRLNSWDRLCIPKPFARIVCSYTPAVPPPADESPETIEEHRLEVERRLNLAHAELEEELGIGDITPGRET